MNLVFCSLFGILAFSGPMTSSKVVRVEDFLSGVPEFLTGIAGTAPAAVDNGSSIGTGNAGCDGCTANIHIGETSTATFKCLKCE